MIDIPNFFNPQNLGLNAAKPSLLTALANSVKSLPMGTLLEGIATKQGPHTQIITKHGQVTVNTPLQIPSDSKLLLKVISNLDNLQLQLLKVNDQEVTPKNNQQTNQATANNTSINNQTTNKNDPTIFQLSNNTKIITENKQQQPSAQTVQNSAGHTPINNNQQITARILTPNDAATQQIIKSLPESAAKLPPQTVGGQNIKVTAGSHVAIKFTNIKLPNAAANNVTTAQNSNTPPVNHNQITNTIPSTVIGHTSDNANIVKTPIGTLIIPTSTPLPKNTELNFDIFNFQINQFSVPNTTNRANTDIFVTQLFKSWQSLNQTVEESENISPKLKQDLTNSLPGPTNNFAAKLQKFVGNLRNGTLAKWLGDNIVSSLKDGGKADVLESLEKDFNAIAKIFNTPTEERKDGWKVLLFPVYDGNELNQVKMYIRDNTADFNNEDDSTRFVIELDLTNYLGEIQFDGLITNSNKNFSLVIRTIEKLPADFELDIINIFINSNDITGIEGNLTFQTTPQIPELVPINTPSPHNDIII